VGPVAWRLATFGCCVGKRFELERGGGDELVGWMRLIWWEVDFVVYVRLFEIFVVIEVWWNVNSRIYIQWIPSISSKVWLLEIST
jgi:hypothetical protein